MSNNEQADVQRECDIHDFLLPRFKNEVFAECAFAEEVESALRFLLRRLNDVEGERDEHRHWRRIAELKLTDLGYMRSKQ